MNDFEISPGDSNEELLRFVEDNLDNPDFVDEVNRSIIFNSFLDGQKLYNERDIEIHLNLLREAQAKGITLKEGDVQFDLANLLKTPTKNFTQEALCKIRGSQAFTFIDQIMLQINGDTQTDVTEYFEVVIAGALGIKYNIQFDQYQTDITIIGQGLVQDTYEIDVVFRPVPKNVQKPQAVS